MCLQFISGGLRLKKKKKKVLQLTFKVVSSVKGFVVEQTLF